MVSYRVGRGEGRWELDPKKRSPKPLSSHTPRLLEVTATRNERAFAAEPNAFNDSQETGAGGS